jgi:hypothetical protein
LTLPTLFVAHNLLSINHVPDGELFPPFSVLTAEDAGAWATKRVAASHVAIISCALSENRQNTGAWATKRMAARHDMQAMKSQILCGPTKRVAARRLLGGCKQKRRCTGAAVCNEQQSAGHLLALVSVRP